MNSDGVVRHELQHTILARYIRFIPLDWSSEGRIGLRLELYGCSYCKYKWTREEKPESTSQVIVSSGVCVCVYIFTGAFTHVQI